MKEEEKTCKQCGELLEKDNQDEYCYDCGLMMSAGGVAPQLAEKIREDRKEQKKN
jgi:hypothetical protein